MQQNVHCQNILSPIKNFLKNRNVSIHFHLMTPRETGKLYCHIWKQLLNAENVTLTIFSITLQKICSEIEGFWLSKYGELQNNTLEIILSKLN